MAFPVVEGTNSGGSSSDVTTLSPSFDAAPSSGQLLLIFWAIDGSADRAVSVTDGDGKTWTKGWTDELESAGHNGGLRWRVSDGTESQSPTFSYTGAEANAWIAVRVSNVASPNLDVTRVESSAGQASADAPSHTPAGGAKDYLWIAYCSGNVDKTVTTFPTNYSGNQITQSSGAGAAGAFTAIATRELNASSEDPGTFSWSGNTDWTAATVAVHPGAGAADPFPAGYQQNIKQAYGGIAPL